ncbi:MAG: B12-binding domain-containing radical SAM protein [Candidatus Omnitrophica bacterium]|nr:B12-binding domain-containing radical SAM protein [Candidatus Omnitrophota bacterium]
MKILLINPPMVLDQDPRHYSIGIGYIDRTLRDLGHDVEILDIDGYRFEKEEVSARIRSSGPDIVGIGGLVTVYPYLHWLVPEIRRLTKGGKIILGGAVASSLKETCLGKLDIDFAVIGEGEVTIKELMEALEGRREISSVKGIGYRDKDKAVFTPKRELMPTLDGVASIDYGKFPIAKLLVNSGGVMQVHVQRGCPWSCTFCFNCYRVVANGVRYRKVRDVVEEIEYLKRTYRVSIFALSGECILSDKGWVAEFCREITSRRLGIKYRVTSRVDTLDEESLKRLRDSGCVIISLGLESGSDKILKVMAKGATREDNKRAAILAKRYIPTIEASLMFGYIGETEETVRESVEFFKEIGIKPYIFFATPFPGTKLFDMAVSKGRIKDVDDYLIGLDRASVMELTINLTDMPDDVYRDVIYAGVNSLRRHFLKRNILNFSVFRSISAHMRQSGIKDTAWKIIKDLGMLGNKG